MERTKTVAIIGSRTGISWPFFQARMHEHTTQHGFPNKVISGGAKGVDTMAKDWALLHHIPFEGFLPQYRSHNDRRAPLIRNDKIIKAADEIIAFHDGESPGTTYVIRKARSQQKKVYVYSEPKEKQEQEFKDADVALKATLEWMRVTRGNGETKITITPKEEASRFLSLIHEQTTRIFTFDYQFPVVVLKVY